MNRKQKLFLNTTSSFIFQITTIICGFILPRLILQSYGSEVNGLINSITQFLGIIGLLELGVGAVVQSSLYKPLADKSNDEISKIIVSATNFFRILARILVIYIIGLMFIFPLIVKQNFDFLYTSILIVAMSISLFAQYYFGIVNRLLLTADQNGYIQYYVQTLTIVLNTVLCCMLISFNFSIQIVKLISSFVYLFQPLALWFYVKRNYSINTEIEYTQEPIKQKWNGVAQHIAAVILDGTDTIVLSIFATLSDVSIYSVYFFVVKGVKQLLLSMTNGIQSLIGELWVKKKINELNQTFGWVEWVIHTATTFVFGCTIVLIIPFMRVYTLGINDANYIQPLFALLIVVANAMHCLRLPYNIMVLAAGHFKQTQLSYIIAAIINIVISILTVYSWGLIGVAIGTLVAMTYQTIYLASYNSKNFIQWSLKKVFKQFVVDIIGVVLIMVVTKLFSLQSLNYTSWIILSLKTSVIAIVILSMINLLFYRHKMMRLFGIIRKAMRK